MIMIQVSIENNTPRPKVNRGNARQCHFLSPATAVELPSRKDTKESKSRTSIVDGTAGACWPCCCEDADEEEDGAWIEWVDAHARG